MKKFNHIPLSISDILIAAKAMDTDSFGRLITAIAKYSADGTIPGQDYFSPEMKLAFEFYRAKIDVVWDQHEKKRKFYSMGSCRRGAAKVKNTKAKSKAV